MEKYQPNLEITLKFLKDYPHARYVLPTTPRGRTSHPKYARFNGISNIIPFTCREDENCYIACPCKCDNIFESENAYVESNFLSLKNMAEHLPQYTFYIESFDKAGLGCCADIWLKYKQRFELEFKNQNNVIFLWPNDNINNS